MLDILYYILLGILFSAIVMMSAAAIIRLWGDR